MRGPIDDRVLDHALEQALGAREETDLPERILQAWTRGVPGSIDVDEVDLDADPLPATIDGAPGVSRNGGHARPQPVLRRLRTLYVAAAAAAVLLLALVWQLSRPPYADAPLAVASSGQIIQIGDVVRVGSEPLDIHLANGAELRAEAGTVLVATEREGRPAFELELGSLELGAGVESLWVTTDFAGVRALPGAELTMSVDQNPLGKRALSMNVTVGVAEFEHDGALLTVVPTRGPRTLAGPVLLAENDIELFDTLFEELCVLRETRMYEAKGLPQRILALEELSGVLARSVPLWARLARRVEERRDDPLSKVVLGNVIDFLHTDPSVEALSLASDLWLEIPELFTETHLVTFAERGAFEFQREIEAMVVMYEPVDDPLLERDYRQDPPVLAATYLAVRGNDAGRELLEKSVGDIQTVERVAPWCMLASLGLDALRDPNAWTDLEQRIQKLVEMSLDDNELIAASRTLLQFQYFQRLRAAPETPILGTVQRDSMRWVEVRRNEVQSEVEILALMRALFG